ncbi:MAG TPA: cysteine--tRNA ligase [Candidatus Sulfotelmatobacter sp.]|nr:cysteine--tRNA ligase [Candidatus Sulfotelmatobacter sp.]
MTLQLYDTMSRRLQPVTPLERGHVRMYTCGPTVYARAHIGNFRTFLFEDVLRRWLERRFPRVTHVMNLTDVEDKIIRNALKDGRTLDEETAPHIAGFFEDLEALGIRPAHHYPRATEYIDAMVDLIVRLQERGVTYGSDGSIYFRIAGFPEYGKLSGVHAQELAAGASGRVDADEYSKEDARDFALWKAVSHDEPGWDTRIGRGRPGWHIECSAMSMQLLGESFDIHCGGVDNIFPHHENEIAQSEAATCHRFVSIWCHGAHLRIEGEKMAKSLGNIATLHELLAEERATPAATRYLLIAIAHYRKVLNYTEEALHASVEAVERFAAFRDRVAGIKTFGEAESEVLAVVESARQGFAEFLDDDLNLPGAMGKVFDAVRDVNRMLDQWLISERARRSIIAFIDEVDDVLGVLSLFDRDRAGALSEAEEELLEARAAARKNRDFATSDRIRTQLREMGITVEDTVDGQRWRRGA